MNLRPRFLLLTALFFVIVALPSWLVVRTLAENIVEQWAVRFAEKQVLYDKTRSLQPILRDLDLTQRLLKSPCIRNWARSSDDPALRQQGIARLEDYRLSFQDKSYFLALLKNGHYYHNNAKNEFADREMRYTLDPKAAKDAWFYDLIRQNRDVHVNVNPDEDLRLVKLWIDVLIRDGDEVLGIAGTGLNIDEFIRNFAEERTPGVSSLFVDHDGAVQIHRDQQLIDFGTISKTDVQKKTIRLVFDRDEDLQAVQKAMRSLLGANQEEAVTALFVTLKGVRHLAGIAYLPEIDWYEITLLNLDILLPFSTFSGLLVIYGLTLAGLLLFFNLALRRHVILPLERLNQAISQTEAGQHAELALENSGTGEIPRLMQHFVQMARAVTESRLQLEAQVAERTMALNRLTKTEPLTELLNRRGMQERLEEEIARAARSSQRLGILWLDMDWFKEINDNHGHAVGDKSLCAIAGLIKSHLRSYDAAARWGGDEFLLLLPNMDQPSLDAAGERLRASVEQCESVRAESGEIVRLTVSIGGHLQEANENVDSLLHRGDMALFDAKEQARNVYRSSRGSNRVSSQA